MTEAGKNEWAPISAPYKASITKAHFLFHEMRVTAALWQQGIASDEARALILQENLYQYPTKRSLNDISRVCCDRLRGLESPELVRAMVTAPAADSKQICLYAMMRQSRLVYEFMHSVIGEKYRTLNFCFSRRDVQDFMSRLQEQNPDVARWSHSTVTKVKGVLIRVLVECGYLENHRSTTLRIVFPTPLLEETLRSRKERGILAAFNIFS